MAIYKLGSLLRSKPEYGANLPGLDNGKYRYFRQTDMTSNVDYKYVNESQGKFLKKGDLLISRTGANAGQPYFHDINTEMVYAGYLIKYEFDESLVKTKYIYYLLLNEKNQIKSLRTGAAQPNFNVPEAVKLMLNIPSLESQQKIIDIIEPIEELFIKYPNTIRLDTFENCKHDVEKIIDIIEPIEELLNNISILKNKLNDILKSSITNEVNCSLGDISKMVREKPRGISQASAKVMSYRDSSIDNLEDDGTYKTNSFYCEDGTLMINTIRTYLNKFAILPFEADVNGTVAQLKVDLEYETIVLANLLNDNFWNEATTLSQGTKMPVIKKDDLLSIELYNSNLNINGLFSFLISINRINIKANEIKNKMINLLIK